MLPHREVNPDFQVQQATPQLTPLLAGSLSPLDSYVVMLYWFLDLDIFWDQ